MKSSSLSEPEPVNKIPDCVYIKSWIHSNNGKARILFTIVFGEHLDTSLSIGELRCGIRRGELRLEIENGRISPSDIEFLKEFAPRVSIKVEDEASDASSATEKATGTIKGTYGVIPSIDSTVEAQTELVTQEGTQRRVFYSDDVYFIKANWDPTRPRWEFYNQFLDKVLHGIVEQLKFAAITIDAKPLILRYKFYVKPKDVVYKEVPLFSKTDIVNKQRILHTLLTKRVIGKQGIVSSGIIEL